MTGEDATLKPSGSGGRWENQKILHEKQQIDNLLDIWSF